MKESKGVYFYHKDGFTYVCMWLELVKLSLFCHRLLLYYTFPARETEEKITSTWKRTGKCKAKKVGNTKKKNKVVKVRNNSNIILH